MTTFITHFIFTGIRFNLTRWNTSRVGGIKLRNRSVFHAIKQLTSSRQIYTIINNLNGNIIKYHNIMKPKINALHIIHHHILFHIDVNSAAIVHTCQKCKWCKWKLSSLIENVCLYYKFYSSLHNSLLKIINIYIVTTSTRHRKKEFKYRPFKWYHSIQVPTQIHVLLVIRNSYLWTIAEK